MLAFLLAALAAASPTFQTLSPAPRALHVLLPLIGRDWVAELPGGTVTDVQRFEWAVAGRFVRNTHGVRTKDGTTVYEGETIYAWDERSQRVVWWYWNSTGGYVVGTLTAQPDGALIAEGDNHGAVNQIDRSRSVLRIGAHEWTMQGSQQRDGVWTTQPERTYRPLSR